MSLRLAGLVLLALSTPVVGWAASGTLNADTLGGARLNVPRCTSAGLTVIQNLTAGTISSITVGGIPSACGSATLQATVNNGTTTGSGTAAVPAGGGAVTVSLGLAPAVTTGELTDIVFVGP